MRLTRLNTGAAVDAAVHLSMAPASVAVEALLTRLASGLLGEIDIGWEWQERVRHLLLDLAHDRAYSWSGVLDMPEATAPAA